MENHWVSSWFSYLAHLRKKIVKVRPCGTYRHICVIFQMSRLVEIFHLYDGHVFDQRTRTNNGNITQSHSMSTDVELMASNLTLHCGHRSTTPWSSTTWSFPWGAKSCLRFLEANNLRQNLNELIFSLEAEYDRLHRFMWDFLSTMKWYNLSVDNVSACVCRYTCVFVHMMGTIFYVHWHA